MQPSWKIRRGACLIWALQTIKDRDNRVLIPGFYDDVRNLEEADHQMLEQFVFNEKETKELLEIDHFINQLSGKELKEQLVFAPTCNICGFASGYTDDVIKTVLPSEATVKIDFRLVPDQDPNKILKFLGSLSNVGV